MAGELTRFYARLATDPDFYGELKKLTEVAALNTFLERQHLSREQIEAVISCNFKLIMEALFKEQKGPIFMGPTSTSTQAITKPPREKAPSEKAPSEQAPKREGPKRAGPTDPKRSSRTTSP